MKEKEKEKDSPMENVSEKTPGREKEKEKKISSAHVRHYAIM